MLGTALKALRILSFDPDKRSEMQLFPHFKRAETEAQHGCYLTHGCIALSSRLGI